MTSKRQAQSRRSDARSRPKPQLSCQNCRVKKLKCDRRAVCHNCAKSHRNCVYLSNGLREDSRPSGSSIEGWTEALEEHSNTPHLVGNGPDMHFVSPSHWEAVLSKIDGSERDDNSMASDSRSSTIRGRTGHPLLLFQGQGDPDGDDLFCPILPRPVVRSLLVKIDCDHVSTWLNMVVHRHTFLEEVDEYFNGSATLSLSWMGLFYAVLSLAAYTVSHMDSIEDLPVPERISHMCMARAARCLRGSDYAEPDKYTVAAMIVYLACEHQWAEDGQFRASIVLGTIVRLATRLAYHRDPVLFPGLSEHQRELRRRTWVFLVQLDLLIALKCGLPRLIDERKTDTAPPLNIRDDDFNSMVTGPLQACALSEPTSVAFWNYKARVFEQLGRVLDQTHNIQPLSYQDVLKIDNDLSNAVSTKPDWLLLPSGGNLAILSVSSVNNLVEADLLEQSTRIMLHREFLTKFRSDKTYAYSRHVCIEAAKRTLYLQRVLCDSVGDQVDPQFRNWRFVSLFSSHFLLAAMLICLDISHVLRTPISDESRREQISHLEAVESAHAVWIAVGKHHASGKRAAAILNALITRFAPVLRPELRRHNENLSSDTGKNDWEAHGAFATGSAQHQGMSSALGILEYGTHQQLHENMAGQPQWTAFRNPDESLLEIQNLLQNSEVEIDWNEWDFGLPNVPLDFDVQAFWN